jgi:hypothetical protein
MPATYPWEKTLDRSIRRARRFARYLCALGFVAASGTSIAPVQAQEVCGGVDYPFPYTDVSGVGAAFCPGIMEAYVTGISKGTTPTTFSPNDTVTRVQMTTFLQRSLDQGLTRASRRAALNQWWTAQTTNAMQAVVVGGNPQFCAADGDAVWTTTLGSVVKVQANSGFAANVWSGATSSQGILVAAGKVFVTGLTTPGTLYTIDPTQASGAVTVAAANLGNNSVGIAFDGTNIWVTDMAQVRC